MNGRPVCGGFGCTADPTTTRPVDVELDAGELLRAWAYLCGPCDQSLTDTPKPDHTREAAA